MVYGFIPETSLCHTRRRAAPRETTLSLARERDGPSGVTDPRRQSVVALGIAFVLGLRHASDPDHLVAVTSLVAADKGDTRRAARLGAWWGAGHAAILLLVGLPLIAFKTKLPTWLEAGAETAVGVVILLLAARVIFKWVRGDYRASPHAHELGH